MSAPGCDRFEVAELDEGICRFVVLDVTGEIAAPIIDGRPSAYASPERAVHECRKLNQTSSGTG